MNKLADKYIKELKLKAHPEGGFYNETFKSEINIDPKHSLWTSIYFLLKEGEVSNLHRLKSDEMWYFHDGSPLTIYMIKPTGELITEQLGLNIDKGEKPQVLVPKGYIFGSSMNETGFSLVGCMVSPGFVFEDFELFKRQDLLNKYPEHKDLINKLTRK